MAGGGTFFMPKNKKIPAQGGDNAAPHNQIGTSPMT